MECQTDDFSAHLNKELKNPAHAAGFLRACLKDAIAEKDLEHYFSAIDAVRKAQKIHTYNEIFSLVKKHSNGEQRASFNENMEIFLIRIRETIGHNREAVV